MKSLRSWGALLAVWVICIGGILGVSLAAGSGPEAEQQTAALPPQTAIAALVAPPAPDSFAISAEDAAEIDAPYLQMSGVDCVAELDRILASTQISFAQGGSQLSDRGAQTLVNLGQQIMLCPDALVMVAGHSDSSGDDASNIAISWDRADAAVDFLVSIGVDPRAVEAVGFGARAPLAQGSDVEDAADRRVDFRVLRQRMPLR